MPGFFFVRGDSSASSTSRLRRLGRSAALPGLFILASLIFLFSMPARSVPDSKAGGAAGKLELKTAAFKPGGDIPRKFTCAGSDVSPALSWNEPPAGTGSLALIMDDPDAPMGTWVHWVVYDLPATTRELPEGVRKGDNLERGGHQGRNDFPAVGYGGPCPPPGKPHRYFFKLYALDRKLDLSAGATKQQMEQAMKGHVLAQAELMGRYGR